MLAPASSATIVTVSGKHAEVGDEFAYGCVVISYCERRRRRQLSCILASSSLPEDGTLLPAEVLDTAGNQRSVQAMVVAHEGR
jgi:hypothetical protein